MVANITTRDGFFTVRQPAWHGLGTVLEDYPTRAEAQAIAHPWEPISEPLYRQVPVVEENGDLTVKYVEAETVRLVARSDDGAELGGNSPTYEPVTNTEMWDIAEALQGDNTDVLYETGGSLLGGRKVWLLLRLAEPIVVKGDPNGAVIPYYALQNAHDGSGSFRGQATNTRIVCDNTSIMADLDARSRGTEFVFRHTKNVKDRVEEAKEALAGWRESIDEWQRLSALMLATEVDEWGLEDFVARFIPMPPPHMASERVAHNVHEAQDQWRSIWDGPTCEGIAGTVYGLVQASIEYQEHYRRARTDETRFRRAYLDRSTIVADATRLAWEVAGV